MNRSDPIAVVSSLDARQLRERLDKLEQERSALVVLLRATLARERKARPRKAVAHAR